MAQLLYVVQRLWCMWQGVIQGMQRMANAQQASGRAATTPPAVLRVAHLTLGFVHPSLQLVHQCLPALLAGEAGSSSGSSGGNSSSSSSPAAAGASGDVGGAVATAIDIQTRILKYVPLVARTYVDGKAPDGDTQLLLPIINSEVLATAALQQLAAFHQLLQQQRQQQRTSGSSSSGSRSGQPQQQAAAAAAAAATPAAQEAPPWLLPNWDTYVAKVTGMAPRLQHGVAASGQAATPLELLQHLDAADMGSAVSVLYMMCCELPGKWRGFPSGSVEQRAQALQRSPAVSAAALRLTLELQLLVAQQLQAVQQQRQDKEHLPAPDQQQQQHSSAVVHNMTWVWLNIGKLVRLQMRAAFAVQGDSLQQLQQQQSGVLLLRALASPLMLDRSGWLSQQVGGGAVNGAERGSGEQLMVLKCVDDSPGNEDVNLAGGLDKVHSRKEVLQALNWLL
jgi:hypothetical protein